MISPAAAAMSPYFVFSSGAGRHLLVTNHTGIYDLPQGLDETSPEFMFQLERLSGFSASEVSLQDIAEPNPQSISLNVSASCNLGCGYCYAGQGSFGGAQASSMTFEAARAAIDRLLAGADRSRPITVGFLGGEPFMNRPLIHQSVGYAKSRAAAADLDVRFAVTTNATLLRADDIELLRANPFAVTVSLDGGRAVHDKNRPALGGRGSWVRAVEKARPLLDRPGRAKVAARATVTAANLDISDHFAALVEAGFPEVGFSPLRVGAGAIVGELWQDYLEALTQVSDGEIRRLRAGEALRLSNLSIALKELHRGAASPYPCGAGGGYFSVGADGDWYACHRAIGDEKFKLGDDAGLDGDARRRFLRERHVDSQADCTRCWARYLCAGGCHHEINSRTPDSCNFVRAWLHYCLAAYCELREGM